MHAGNEKFRPGDRLERQKGIFTHVGVYAGSGNVLHSTPGTGAHLVSVSEFSQGLPIRHVPTPDASRTAVLARMHKELVNRTPYDYLTNNCQHLATRVIESSAYSEDLTGWVLVLAGGFLFLAANR